MLGTTPLRKADNLDDSVDIATYRNHRDNPVARALRHNVTSTALTRG